MGDIRMNVSRLAFFIGLIYLISIIPVFGWYGEDWKYRKSVEVYNNEDFEVQYFLIKLDTYSLISEGKLREDAKDLKITDNEDREVPFYISKGLNTHETYIWIKYPLPPKTRRTLYLYYGNPNFVGAQIPLFRDIKNGDFSQEFYGWEKQIRGEGEVVIDNGKAKLGVNNCSSYARIIQSFTLVGKYLKFDWVTFGSEYSDLMHYKLVIDGYDYVDRTFPVVEGDTRVGEETIDLSPFIGKEALLIFEVFSKDCEKERIVYVNRTVYKDRIVYRTVYRDRVVYRCTCCRYRDPLWVDNIRQESPSVTFVFGGEEKKIKPTLKLLLNGKPSDLEVYEGEKVDVYAEISDPSLFFYLYEDGRVVGSGYGVITYSTSSLSIGEHNYTAYFPGEDGYEKVSISRKAKVIEKEEEEEEGNIELELELFNNKVCKGDKLKVGIKIKNTFSEDKEVNLIYWIEDSKGKKFEVNVEEVEIDGKDTEYLLREIPIDKHLEEGIYKFKVEVIWDDEKEEDKEYFNIEKCEEEKVKCEICCYEEYCECCDEHGYAIEEGAVFDNVREACKAAKLENYIQITSIKRELKTEAGKRLEVLLRVKNIYFRSVVLQLSIEGLPEDWYTIENEKLVVWLNEEKAFRIVFNIPENADPKDYPFNYKLSFYCLKKEFPAILKVTNGCLHSIREEARELKEELEHLKEEYKDKIDCNSSYLTLIREIEDKLECALYNEDYPTAKDCLDESKRLIEILKNKLREKEEKKYVPITVFFFPNGYSLFSILVFLALLLFLIYLFYYFYYKKCYIYRRSCGEEERFKRRVKYIFEL